MKKLAVSQFGEYTITLDGARIELRNKKAKALLAYLLANETQNHSRETLMTMLWPDSMRQSAQTNLRQTLDQLHTSIPQVPAKDGSENTSFLLADRQTVQINPAASYEVDTIQFTQFVQNDDSMEALEIAAELYQGQFLKEFYLPDSYEFEDWLANQRALYMHQVLAALDKLATYHLANKAYDLAQQAARRQLEIDDLRETAVRQLMTTLAKSGHRTAAMAEYDQLFQRLSAKLEIEPSTETTTLYQQIQADELRQTQIKSPKQKASKDKTELSLPPESKHEDQPLPLPPPVIQPSLPEDRRNHLILLDKVNNAWVKGVLEPLEEAVLDAELLTLGRQYANELIDHPWRGVVATAVANQPIPDDKTTLDLFIASDRALLILGDPGAGKSTTLIQLTRDLISLAKNHDNQPIPVLLNLSSWAESEGKLTDWVVKELTTKYQIPRKIGRDWVDANQLLLLLDGLDEMPPSTQPKCVQAINHFREEHGLTGLVVCSRRADYESYSKQLTLGGTFIIQSLTLAQIDAYLATFKGTLASLRTAVHQDTAIQEMAKSPLMLSIMCQTYSGEEQHTPQIAELAAVDDTAVRHHQLFNDYVAKMFQRRGTDSPYSPAQTRQWLSWIAQRMSQHHQRIFQLEETQPSWLSNRFGRWGYLLLTRCAYGVVNGVILWLIVLFAIELNLSFGGTELYQSVAGQLQVSFQLAALTALLSLNTIVGLIISFVDFYRFEHSSPIVENIKTVRNRRIWFSAGTGATIFLLTSMFFVLRNTVQYAIGAGLWHAIIWTVAFLSLFSVAYHSDIHPVGALKWSWKDALRGLLLGLVVGSLLAFVFSPFLESSPNLPFLAANLAGGSFFLIGGMKTQRLETSSMPNEGVKISIRNSLYAALVFAVFLGLLGTLLYNVRIGILASLWFGLAGAGLYGGGEAWKHGVLRLLFRWQKQMPLRFVPFLNHTTQLTLLHRVGGGYIFIHPLLQEYFARLNTNGGQEPVFSQPTSKNIIDHPTTTNRKPAVTLSSQHHTPPLLPTHFTQIELVATGGQGKIYRAVDSQSGQLVAIKQLKNEGIQKNQENLARFHREGEALSQLNHPNIVRILDMIEQDEKPLIIMEYVAGGSLKDLLDKGTRLPIDQVLSIALELADALARAHHLGIIHRDIKPANVLLAEDGTPRLTDFGIAYLSHQDTRLTKDGTIIGSPIYMSPEACKGERLEAPSDIWSFGVLLFELIAGQPPFNGDVVTAILIAILNQQTPDLSQYRLDVPTALQMLVEKMLVKETNGRKQSMRQIAAELEQIKGDFSSR